ncbi:DNA polymerase, partial [Gemmata sp. JC673]
MDPLAPFREVWCADFEFRAPDGHTPEPLCLVARELRSGRRVRLWLTDGPPSGPPFAVGPDALFVAYYASAELGCFLALGWPVPVRVLDLFAEFRVLTNGRALEHGSGLLGALAHFGLDGLGAAEKEDMRALAMRAGPHTAAERAALLDYCATDVDALARLLPRMAPRLDLPRALLRGRYMAAAARMERTGVPLDTAALAALRANWDALKARLVREVDRDYGVFVPTGRRLDPGTTFGAAVFATAAERGLDPFALADAAEHLHRLEVEATADRRAAIRAARRATGLTEARVQKLLGEGKDYLDVPGLDVHARELADERPDLGIGTGYDPDGVDDDSAPKLWAVLAEPDPAPRPKHHPDVIRRAADLIGPGDRLLGDGPLTFSADRWAAYLARTRIAWPRLPSGALALDDETFRERARAHPAEVGPIRELRHTLGQMRLHELAVGPDGRNRCLLSAFRSRTGRNQPSNARFVFGPSCWLRSLIRPEPGRALAYVDWSQQELAIAAALSGDPNMMDAYTSGDFYLTFAKLAGAVPPAATKQTYAAERDQFKTVALGVLYGLGAEGLARKLGEPPHRGRHLLELHRRTFRRFWAWADGTEERALLTGRLRTAFGWAVRVGRDANPRSLRNFPMQAHGAEMMRLAACLATERGIRVCCPVHDAFLIEADAGAIDAETARMQDAMREASVAVLPGFPLKTDAKVVRHPDRYTDPRGA